jgi:hypothetical protein
MPRRDDSSGGAVGTTSMPPDVAIRWYTKPGRASNVPTSSPAAFFLVNVQLIVRCCRRTRVERVAGQHENMCAAAKCSGALNPCRLSSLSTFTLWQACTQRVTHPDTCQITKPAAYDISHRKHGQLTHPAIYRAARSSIDVSEPRQWRRSGSKNNSKDSLSHRHLSESSMSPGSLGRFSESLRMAERGARDGGC